MTVTSLYVYNVKVKYRPKIGYPILLQHLIFEAFYFIRSRMSCHLKYRNRNSVFRYVCSKGKNPPDPVVEAPLYHLRSGRSVLNIGKMQSSALSSARKPLAAGPEVIGISLYSLGSANQNGRH